MQQLKTAVAVFCTACICAELVGRLLGDVWGRQCIKAAAGLYILVALFHALPSIRAGVASFTPPDVPAASFGTMEDVVLQQAQRSLADRLEAQIAEETGLAVTLDIVLASTQTGVQVVRAEVSAPAETTPQDRTAVQELLCNTLETGTEAIAWTGQAEGG